MLFYLEVTRLPGICPAVRGLGTSLVLFNPSPKPTHRLRCQRQVHISFQIRRLSFDVCLGGPDDVHINMESRAAGPDAHWPSAPLPRPSVGATGPVLRQAMTCHDLP